MRCLNEAIFHAKANGFVNEKMVSSENPFFHTEVLRSIGKNFMLSPCSK